MTSVSTGKVTENTPPNNPPREGGSLDHHHHHHHIASRDAYGKRGVEKNPDTPLPLIKNLEARYPGLFSSRKEAFIKQLKRLQRYAKYREIIIIIALERAFTKNELMVAIHDEGIRVGKETVTQILRDLIKEGLLGVKVVRGNLPRPAQIHYVIDDPVAVLQAERLEEFFRQHEKAYPVKEKTPKKNPEEIAERTKKIWQAQSEAAKELRKQKQERNKPVNAQQQQPRFIYVCPECGRKSYSARPTKILCHSCKKQMIMQEEGEK